MFKTFFVRIVDELKTMNNSEVNIADFMKRIKRGAKAPIDSLGRYERDIYHINCSPSSDFACSGDEQSDEILLGMEVSGGEVGEGEEIGESI